jgi:hypothetical protein
MPASAFDMQRTEIPPLPEMQIGLGSMDGGGDEGESPLRDKDAAMAAASSDARIAEIQDKLQRMIMAGMT